MLKIELSMVKNIVAEVNSMTLDILRKILPTAHDTISETNIQ